MKKTMSILIVVFLITSAMAQSQIGLEDLLIPFLKDNDSDVRAEAANALGNIGGERSIIPLIRALSDDNNSVQESALFALFQIGDPAKTELMKVLHDKNADSKQKKAVINALNKWSVNVKTYSSITEIGGLDIANRIANNWSDSAKLIQIGLAESTMNCENNKCALYFTGWGYIYESNNEYIAININISDYEADYGRLGEINQTSAWPFKFKQSLSGSWSVTVIDALDVLSTNGYFSEERGDVISTLYLDMGSFNNQITPLWHISIINEDTKELKSYLINAKNKEFLVDYS